MGTKDQLAKTVGSLLKNATPKLESPTTFPPATLNQPFFASPSLDSIAHHTSKEPMPSQDAKVSQTMNLGVINAGKAGKVAVLNVPENKYTYHTVKAGEELNIPISSTRQRSTTMRIGIGQLKVVLVEGRVIGGKMVGEVAKNLPAKVVLMRMLGWYKEFFVLRKAEEAGGSNGSDRSDDREEYFYLVDGEARTKKQLELMAKGCE